MQKFIIEMPHTKEECLNSMDEVAKSPEFLSRTDWGCNAGIHTGWAVVEAKDKSSALNMVPSTGRNKARVVPVDRLTLEQINSFHQK